jgi:hypothetical protein
MSFDEISNNTQIEPNLKHNQTMRLRLFYFCIFKIFYKLYEINYQYYQN